MDARVQRRVQRYGWDLAAGDYEALWEPQLAVLQRAVLEAAALAPGEQVLDVACGTGLVTLAAARVVGLAGGVTGVDLSGQMIESAGARAHAQGLPGIEFARMDAEALSFDAGRFDVVLCSLGLMYVPDSERALREMHRVLRPGGRLVVAVWGERARCGWSALFEIVQHEVTSEVCPLFFRLGQAQALARACREAGFDVITPLVVTTTLDYVDSEQACGAAFAGGPVALAWSRFDDTTRRRVTDRYMESIARWRRDDGSYRVPGEFRIVTARSGSPGSR